MFKNRLDVALRSFLGNKLFSFTNLFGLAVGLASAILIGLYVADELSYDRFHSNADRLYRIARDFYPEVGGESHLATLPPPAAALLRESYPEIEAAARVRHYPGLLRRDDQAFYENGLQYADPDEGLSVEYPAADQRLQQTCADLECNRMAGGALHDGALARELRLPYRPDAADLRRQRADCAVHRVGDGRWYGGEGGESEASAGFAV